jgi:hypothetical protein
MINHNGLMFNLNLKILFLIFGSSLIILSILVELVSYSYLFLLLILIEWNADVLNSSYKYFIYVLNLSILSFDNIIMVILPVYLKVHFMDFKY